MPRTLFVIILCLIAATATVAFGQDEKTETEKTFNLLHTSVEEQEARKAEEMNVPVYEPIISERNMEVSLTLGFWQIDKVLLSHDDIIYKYTEKDSYYGNIELVGQSAFNPQLRVNYNILPWFSLEPVLGISVSEYLATVDNPRSISNQAFGEEGNALEPVEELGEFDAENRSCITMSTGLNAVFYPRDYGNFGKGRWHPYVQGGAHHTWMSLNSDYLDDAAKMWDLSGGLGLRYVADDMISVRFEVMYHQLTVDFTPAQSFVVRDEGSTQIPIYEWIGGAESVQSVSDFESQSLNSMSWAFGFTATF